MSAAPEAQASKPSLIEAYAGPASEELPIAGYATLGLTYASVFGSLLWAGAKRSRLPEFMGWRDIVLLGLATHRLSRILTRDRVAAPLRMPFTEYEGKAGAGEVKERPRGRGLRRAVGSLLTCQFCAGPWIAASLATALTVQPRPTRLVASVLTAVSVSDFAHQLYAGARSLSAK